MDARIIPDTRQRVILPPERRNYPPEPNMSRNQSPYVGYIEENYPKNYQQTYPPYYYPSSNLAYKPNYPQPHYAHSTGLVQQDCWPEDRETQCYAETQPESYQPYQPIGFNDFGQNCREFYGYCEKIYPGYKGPHQETGLTPESATLPAPINPFLP